ncbi:hypothetical protein [Sporolactobacillus inulinus]|uniref:hypothetical protein n=1 Tax=Sporolactobacillus inulinus TaxID=2078 RepID=UPI00031E0B61|nr:hypothetical protein [Sporolactobacillus inulinus]GEB78435.1 hypothetical protein SIN01_27800 [Sporolactobacillus inulinus]
MSKFDDENRNFDERQEDQQEKKNLNVEFSRTLGEENKENEEKLSDRNNNKN